MVPALEELRVELGKKGNTMSGCLPKDVTWEMEPGSWEVLPVEGVAGC